MTTLSNSKQTPKTIFIIGSNGRLAKALANVYRMEEVISLDRKVYENWGYDDKHEEIRSYFESRLNENSYVLITSGILNAKEDSEIINRVNFHLPNNIIHALEGLDVGIATFGTILEKLEDSDNPYVQSKIKLSNSIGEFSSDITKVYHFRLHTLYGYDHPSEFMFLGQIFTALRSQTPFHMSSGYQIREYHHLDDIAESVNIILSEEKTGVCEITSGNGIRLRDLALCIFAEFKAPQLLHIGELDIEHKDKFLNDYRKNIDLVDVDFRDPLEGVNAYLKSIL